MEDENARIKKFMSPKEFPEQDQPLLRTAFDTQPKYHVAGGVDLGYGVPYLQRNDVAQTC